MRVTVTIVEVCGVDVDEVIVYEDSLPPEGKLAWVRSPFTDTVVHGLPNPFIHCVFHHNTTIDQARDTVREMFKKHYHLTER